VSGVGLGERAWKILKDAGSRGVEVAAAMLLVVFFFLALLGVLTLLFPKGTGLRELMRGGKASLPTAEGHPAGPVAADPGPVTRPIVAVVTTAQNNVHSRRADAIAWEPTFTGMQLGARDAVQTARNSSASIRFGAGGSLYLGENSLVILRRMEQDVVRREKRTFLLMVEGELRGRIEGTKQEPAVVDVASSGGSGRIVSRGGEAGAADFRVAVGQDRTTTYSVFEGTAEVESMGKKVVVGSNQFTTVAPAMPPTAPDRLPAAPEPAAPADGIAYAFRSLPPEVRFSWTATEPADGYRFVLARDAAFRDVVIEKTVAEPSFTHGNLAAGTYYWRVSAKRKLAESPFGVARSFRLAERRTSPALRVEALPGPGSEDFCRVRGATDPGSRVFVAGKPVVPGESGGFESLVPLQRGINVIVVEAMDAAGNGSYRSLRANRTY